MKLGAYIRRYRQIGQNQGWLAAANSLVSESFAICSRIGLRFYDVHHYVCEIASTGLLEHPRIAVSVEPIGASQVERMSSWLPVGKKKLFLERLKDGKQGLVCIHNGEIIYYTWYTTKDEYDSSTQSWVHLESGQGYLFDSHCRPEFRGRGLHSFMNAQRLVQLAGMGCRTALGRVHSTNYSSRWTLATNGFVPHDRVIGIGIGSRLLRFKLRPQRLKWERSRV